MNAVPVWIVRQILLMIVGAEAEIPRVFTKLSCHGLSRGRLPVHDCAESAVDLTVRLYLVV
jgi:hypothetical protein